jgi:hypothetical protein
MANPEVEVLLAELGIGVEPDRTTWLCHATTSATAQVIQQSGVLRSRDGLVYVATHPAIACRIVDPADGVLRVRVAVDDLYVHRRPDELDDRIPQAEFVVYPTSGDEYEPAEIDGFTAVDRDDY